MLNELRRKVERGDISLRSAAYKLMRMGRVKFLPSDKEVLRLLHIFIQKIMKRTTIKSLTIQANEIESADYMDILIRDVVNGNYSQLHERLSSMSKKDLLRVIDDVAWNLYGNDGYAGEELMKIHKYAVKAMEDKL